MGVDTNLKQTVHSQFFDVLDGHILAPPEGLRAPEVPRVDQESGGDSKAI